MEGILTSYAGPEESGRYEGEGVYTYPDGTRFEGAFHNGAFHGKGRLVFPNGVFDGVFKDGKEAASGVGYTNDAGLPRRASRGEPSLRQKRVAEQTTSQVGGQYIFNDGLTYEEENWGYSTPKDRRFYTEREADSVNPAGELQYSDKPVPEIPRDCFDAGDGQYLDPRSGFIHDLQTKKKVRECPAGERRWIEHKCRTSNN